MGLVDVSCICLWLSICFSLLCCFVLLTSWDLHSLVQCAGEAAADDVNQSLLNLHVWAWEVQVVLQIPKIGLYKREGIYRQEISYIWVKWLRRGCLKSKTPTRRHDSHKQRDAPVSAKHLKASVHKSEVANPNRKPLQFQCSLLFHRWDTDSTARCLAFTSSCKREKCFAGWDWFSCHAWVLALGCCWKTERIQEQKGVHSGIVPRLKKRLFAYELFALHLHHFAWFGVFFHSKRKFLEVKHCGCYVQTAAAHQSFKKHGRTSWFGKRRQKNSLY